MARRRRKPAAGAGVQGRSPCLEAVGTVNTVKPHGGEVAAGRSSRHCTNFAMGDLDLLWGPLGQSPVRLERGTGESGFARVKKCNTKAKGLAGQWMARMRGKDQVCIGYYPTTKDAAYRCATYGAASPAEEMEAVSLASRMQGEGTCC